MQTKIVLASLVAAVAADNLIAMRQAANPFGGLSKQCQDDLAEVQGASDLPAIPTDFIQDAIAAAATLTNPCDYTPTGTVAAEYTSFISAAESWASKHTSIASKIEKDCSAPIDQIGDICPKTSGGASKPTSGSGSSSSGSSNGNGSGSSKTAGSSEATGTTSGGQAKSTGDGKGAAAVNGPAGALMVAALGAVALL